VKLIHLSEIKNGAVQAPFFAIETQWCMRAVYKRSVNYGNLFDML
jgi:hypothetical protein